MKTFLRTAVLAATATLLAGCGIGDTGGDDGAAGGGGSASESGAEGPGKRDGAGGGEPAIDVNFDDLQQVSPSYFSERGESALTFTVDGTTGECFGQKEFVTCIGQADESVPDIEFMGRQGRPGAIKIGPAGVAYTGVEGAPPATEELRTGHWVNLGGVKCGKPDDSRLVCAADGGAFEISGADREIRTEGTVYSDSELPEVLADMPATDYSTGTDVLVRAPMTCGAMEGHRLVDVVKGEITCEEAMDVLDRYDSIARERGGGNTRETDFDGWGCSYPAAGRSSETRANSVCEHTDRGIRLEGY